MKTTNQIPSVPLLKPVFLSPLAVLLLVSASAFSAAAQTVTSHVTSQYTDYLYYSGYDESSYVDVVSDAQASPDSLTPAFSVPVPNQKAPRLLNFINAAVAIPFGSPIRQLEAYWNGTPLPLIELNGTDGQGQEIQEDLDTYPHSYGLQIPFFKPLFSVASVPPGLGTLKLDAFDSNHLAVATVSISNLTVVQPPPPIPTSAVAALAHPRIYLTPARLAAIRARPESDVARQRYETNLNAFLSALAANTNDVLSPNFPSSSGLGQKALDGTEEDSIPLLALAYQLNKNDDTNTAQLAAAAAHTLATNLANEYATGQLNFGHDDGMHIRDDLKNLMLAYDWINDVFSPGERALIAHLAENWIDWYGGATNNDGLGYYIGTISTNTYRPGPGDNFAYPVNNYYTGYLQGIALAAFATAGDTASADGLFTLLRAKLGTEVPMLNQREAGGDWAEGGEYGPQVALECSLLNTLLLEAGEDWSADFDWLQATPRSLLYLTSPDFSQTRSYGGYSGSYPHRTSPSMLAVLSSTTADGAFASLVYNRMATNPNQDFKDDQSDVYYEMIFASNPPAPSLSSLPLSYFNSGSGRFFSRSSLTDPDAYFVSTENMSYCYDHFGYANGDVRLYHGTNCLVGPSAYEGLGNSELPPRWDDSDGESYTASFSTYRAGSLLFDTDIYTGYDFTNSQLLAQELRTSIDPVSTYLWNGFSTATQQALMITNASDWPEALIGALNQVILGPSIYDATRFSNANVTLSPATSRLASQNPKGADVFRFNRLLLEDAYPGLIIKKFGPAGAAQGADQEETDQSNNRNNQYLFAIEAGTYSAVAMRFESSCLPMDSSLDENILDAANPLDYLIREVVHLRPGTLVVRDLHRRRHDTDALSAQWHIGLTNPVQSVNGSSQIGTLHVLTFYPPDVTVSFTDDNLIGINADLSGGDRIGTLMQLDFAASTAPLELVTVFSETQTATSYTNGVLLLDDGTRVTFAHDGTLSVLAGTVPTLTINRSGTNVFVSWPLSSTSFILQQNGTLSLTNWTAVPQFPTTNGATINVTVPVSSASEFYRLKSQ